VFEHEPRYLRLTARFSRCVTVGVELQGHIGLGCRTHLRFDNLPRETRPAVASLLMRPAGPNPRSLARPGGLARFERPNPRFGFADSLARALQAAEEGLQTCIRDSVLDALRQIRAELLSLAVVAGAGRQVAAFHLDHHPVFVVEVAGPLCAYRGQLMWCDFEPPAAAAVMRFVG
jgi:hypothetical protein